MHKVGFALTVLLLFAIFLQSSFELKRRKHKHRHRIRWYNLTLSVRNHNITEARFFQIRGPGHTAYFRLLPESIFTQTFEVQGKGNWVLFVEFGNNFYAKSRAKIISRDSYRHWFMELYSYRHGGIKNKTKTEATAGLPDAIGFTDWEKVTRDKFDDKLLY